MNVVLERGRSRLVHGDSLEVLATLEPESIDACVCDPPYELGFMGRAWDASGIAYNIDLWRLALRALKPGGHLLAFGGTRTYHRLACAVEDAGFEIRDSLHWVYGSGFPKSLDVSKAIDKAAGHWRGQAGEVTGRSVAMSGPHYERTDKGDPVTAAAAAWDGWGTALKPAHEPIVVARKPLVGTVAQNVLAHGTGALNIDATRVGTAGGTTREGESHVGASGWTTGHEVADIPAGRWPPNVLLTHAADCTAEGCEPSCPVRELDEQSGHSESSESSERSPDPPAAVTWGLGREGGVQVGHGDAGGASRFFPTFAPEADDDALEGPPFRYVPKAGTAQREAGTDHLEPRVINEASPPGSPGAASPRAGAGAGAGRNGARGNLHPTVKPVGLMRWLVRLVTPPGGTVLDPFAGSGSTLVACIAEGFDWVAVEREAEYLPIIEGRVKAAEKAMVARGLRDRMAPET